MSSSSSAAAAAAASQPFWCHDCALRVTLLSPLSDPSSSSSSPTTPSLLCPRCRGDFLEQMDSPSVNTGSDYASLREARFDELMRHFSGNPDALLHRPSPPHSRAASKSAVEALPTVKITASSSPGDDPFVCAICKDQIEVDSEAKKLPCTHLYHSECILPWLSSHNSCPLCRFRLPTEAEEWRKESRRDDEAWRTMAANYANISGLDQSLSLRILSGRRGLDFPAGDGENPLDGVISTSQQEFFDMLLGDENDGLLDEAVEALLSDVNGFFGAYC